MIVTKPTTIDGKTCDVQYTIILDQRTARGAAYEFILNKIYDGLQAGGKTKIMTANRKHAAWLGLIGVLHDEGAKI